MKLLNFAHPLTGGQIESIRNIVGEDVEVTDIRVQIDNKAPILPQVRAIANQAVEALAGEYQDYIVNPPGLSIVAVLLTLRLPGHFRVVRMVSDGGTPPRFNVTEVI